MFVRSPSHSEQREGIAAVEFAIVAPLFFMVLYGIIEVSWALCCTNMAFNVARESAHVAVMSLETEANILSYAETIAVRQLSIPADKINVAISVADQNGNAKASYADAIRGDLVMVEVSVSYSDLSLMPVEWLSGVPIRGHCSMMKL